jgi:predicted GNAT family acetyltransferase
MENTPLQMLAYYQCMTPAVQHDPEAAMFYVEIDGHRAVLNYRCEGGTMSILHTGVPPAVGGRGVAADLTRTALEFARSKHWKVRPICPYTAVFVRQHPEFADLLAS